MSIFSWGSSRNGCLGTEKAKHFDPLMVDFFRGKPIVSLDAGEHHSAAVGASGDVYVWGRGREGQLGGGAKQNDPQMVPLRVWGLRHERVTQLSCGFYHTIALASSGRVYEWGKVHQFEEDSSRPGSAPADLFGSSIRLAGLREGMQSLIESSHREYYRACMSESEMEEMEESKQITNFGRFIPLIQPTPTLVEGLPSSRGGDSIVWVCAGYSFSIAIDGAGCVWSWGFNDKFQLGLGHRYNQTSPQKMVGLDGVRIISGSCGQAHSLLLDACGAVYGVGFGVFGKLGNGSTRDEGVPRIIDALEGVRIVQVACGAYHSLALDHEGNVWTWGSAEYAQQAGRSEHEDYGGGGTGRANTNAKESSIAHAVPRRIDAALFAMKKVVHISCGHLHNAAVTRDGQLYTWGWGGFGRLGHGDERYKLLPTAIRRLRGEVILKAAAGSTHTLAVTKASENAFAVDFKRAVESHKYSDLEIFVDRGKHVLRAHRCIVFSRCPSLRRAIVEDSAHLQHDECSPMAVDVDGESSSPLSTSSSSSSSSTPDAVEDGDHESFFKHKCMRASLPDVPLRVARGFLHYLYTDRVVCPPHILRAVGDLGERFGLARLAQVCHTMRLEKEDLHQEAKLVDVDPSTIEEDFGALLPNHKDAGDAARGIVGSDVLFRVDHGGDVGRGVVVGAHKVILACRSDYFSRIFSSGFRESQGSRTAIPLEDVDGNTFKTMLRYIYTGDDTLVTLDNVVELLEASDRFLLDDMKQLCELIIEDTLDGDVVCDLLAISDRANAPRLMHACTQFIRDTWPLTRDALDEMKGYAPELVERIHRTIEHRYGEGSLIKGGEESKEEEEKTRMRSSIEVEE